jgi:hypothetical protein
LVVSPDRSLQNSTDKDDQIEPVPCGQLVVPDGFRKFGERLAVQVNQSPQVAVILAKSTKIAASETAMVLNGALEDVSTLLDISAIG